MSGPGARRDRGGFALALVVLMLFAIAVAGAAGYQVVSGEFTLAQQNRDGQEALAVARAGLYRFAAEQIGVLGDSVSYAIGDGIAAVTAQKVMEKDSLNHLYLIRSVGQVADARTPLLPATRTVATMAWHRLNPIPPKAAMVLTGGQIRLYSFGLGSTVSGADHATPSDCAFGGTVPRYGIATAGSISTSGGSYSGTPAGAVYYSNYAAAYDTVGVRWDILSDPSFPVDYDGSWPDFASLLATNPDTFPLIRVNGDFNAWEGYSGQGVLIVTGRLTLLGDFTWDGIILAGRLYYIWGGSYDLPRVNGMLIGGLNSSNPTSYLYSGEVFYHSCNAYMANRSLSYLELVENSLFEVNN